ncbi:NTP transferase domain-containing protein [Mucilaginibacter sp.]|uniref:NTP transferase domain-containing protein n=1 Tax=Mucilaginibacter sp. TaxID=1882438 RepID=UPI00261DA49F|nr:NTP transferase domain-containing protein [Mucilaginibacter sp.]MDB4926146.1 molybdopterin-guanine dinucleotide biosynthesis protein MobA [Mucilaginibacter sp.]
MISKEHKKHTSLVRPVSGNFGRNEWAILGAPCINIKLLANEVINALSPQYKCAYADTSHNDEVTLPPGRLAGGAVLEYTDQLNYHQFNHSTALKPINFKQQFADDDMVLVNGNHQPAKAQVVIIYNNKSASLQKRVAQLTNVELILLADNVDDVFDFIKEAIPNWQQLPICRLEETDKIIAFFEAKMQQAKPILNGLVLAGGQSIRMGHDKGALNWYGKEQQYYMADILKELCEDVFISCRPEQKQKIDTTYNTLTDTFIGLGPFGAILSAFRENPNSAWLVVACDLPLLDANTLQYLIANRNPSAIATAYENAHDGFPEPLITIWEPKSYPILLAFLAQGYSCPRKVLINSDIALLKAENTDALTNVNTPEDFEKIKRQIHQKIAST